MSWPIEKFEKLASSERHAFVGGPFGSKLTSNDYTDEGVPVIRGANMSAGRYIGTADFVFVSEEKKNNDLKSNLARPNDLVFTQRGTLGQVAIIPETGPYREYVISQSQMKMTIDTQQGDRDFYYYYFSSKQVVERILNMTSSSGVPHINLTTLKNFDVPVPPLQSQKRIASILSAYDDLIENNRRRIALLEEAARLLYREWFVHFRFPGHEHVKIIDGVPEGWRQSTIGNECPLIYGKALKADSRVAGNCDVYGSSGIVGSHNKKLVSGPAIVVGRKGNVGSVHWARRDFWPIDTTYYLAPENSNFFNYYALQHIEFLNTDVAVPGLNRDYAHSRKLLVPQSDLRIDFEMRARLFQDQIGLLQRQSAELAKARDLLLPRLMDGRLEV